MKKIFQKMTAIIMVFLLFSGCEIGEEQEIPPSETVLIDVDGKAEYDLTALYAPQNGEKVEWTFSSKYGALHTVTTSNGTLDLSTVQTQVYDAVATVKGKVKYRGEVDFCDSEEDVVWNTASALEYATLYRFSTCHYHARLQPTPTTRYQFSLTDEAPERTGNYYKIQTLKVDTWFEFVLLPLHSLKYYEQLGSGYSLTFDYRFVANGNEETEDYNHFAFNGQSGVKCKSNEWRTKSIELGTLTQNYTALTTHEVDETQSLSTYTRMLIGMAHEGNTDYITLYIGNFQLERVDYDD